MFNPPCRISVGGSTSRDRLRHFRRQADGRVGRIRQADKRRNPKDFGAMTSPTRPRSSRVGRRCARQRRPRLTGGKRVPPRDYFEPTVLVDVDHSMKWMADETFAPVVG